MKDTFAMLRVKNNLARADGSGLTYKIESTSVPIPGEGEIFSPFIKWGEMVEKSADEALGARRNREGSSKGGRPDEQHQKALRFLQETLQDGPRPATWVLDHGKALGLSEKTLHRAADELHVDIKQKARKWLWILPPVEAYAEVGEAPIEAEVEADEGRFL